MTAQMDNFISYLQVLSITILALIVVELTEIIRKQQQAIKRRRSVWVRRLLKERSHEGAHAILIPRLFSDEAH